VGTFNWGTGFRGMSMVDSGMLMIETK